MVANRNKTKIEGEVSMTHGYPTSNCYCPPPPPVGILDYRMAASRSTSLVTLFPLR